MFPRVLNLSSLSNVVIGRYCVDGEIFFFSDALHIPIFDLTPLHSVHQGIDSSSNIKSRISDEDFFYDCTLRPHTNLLGYQMHPQAKVIFSRGGLATF